MAKAQFEAYVIHTGPGDPLPRIGSGMRLVEALVGRKWVRVRAKSGDASRVPVRRWAQDIPHVRYIGQSLREVLAEFGRGK